ncbi:hypothetical protein KFK09_012760 [Dendrobium nobile]|uniref:CCHC-type domain-containing protein n=1 Tax=Dendrobium nobile TaxID=94219 RepID=A0A8T3BIC5_DENNO|nr:hypothetical protein KFK09_012759 [Dendrobium nobile]KAI0512124.1 hypothetical protein KFK09_012760 [Dendrobium nobile]
MSMQRLEIDKFKGENDFSLWRIKMKALLVHQGLSDAIFEENFAAITDRAKAREIQLKAHSIILLSIDDEVLREVAEEDTALKVWRKLESIYMKKSLTNRLLLKKQLYTLQMEENQALIKHLNDFNKLILDLRNVDVKIVKEDQGIILLSSLPKTYENIVDTMLYGKQTLTLTKVKSVLMSKDVQRKIDQKEDKNDNILIARGRSESRRINANRKCYHCNKEGHTKRFCPTLSQGVEPEVSLAIAADLGDGSTDFDVL